MDMKPQDWLDIIRSEYLQDFIRRGGSAVKFVLPAEEMEHDKLRDQLGKIAKEEGFLFAFVDAKSTKIHMIDKLFHEVARQVDWDELAYSFVTKILRENGRELPSSREEFNLQQIAKLNGLEEMLLRGDLQKWLGKAIFRDFEMSQEFRIAMIRLCLAQLDPGDASPFLSNAVKEWLRGELRQISALKEALIFQKVARHNARHMLFSLAHWLKVNGMNGLVLSLDISRYTVAKPKDPDDSFYYSVPATLDAYEVLRQFIDGTDELECCFISVVASREFLTDEKRGLNRYDALKLRIGADEVRDRHRQNPFASLIRISSGKQT